MNFYQLLDRLRSKESALIIYCILDRIPIMVFGDNPIEINDFIIELSELIPFRKEIVFYTDFVSKNEYTSLIQIEDNDYNSQRIHIRCPCEVSLKALSQFDNFNSWIIGILIPKQKEDLYVIKNLIKEKLNKFLKLNIANNKISTELEGINIKLLDLTFEENILKKIFHDTDESITRMRRVLSDKIKSKTINNDIINTLLDFSVEKIELKKNIFNKEIHNFYSASKRAFFILSRLSLLNNLNINAQIGSRILLKTIDYEQTYMESSIVPAPLFRIISFIHNEWRENLTDLIQDDKKVDVEEKIQSLWV